MNTDHLFSEFEKNSPAAWKQKIQVELDGDDYNETLLWKTTEGIVVKPFYTKEDSTDTQIGSCKNTFNICQTIFIDDEKVANKIAINALKKGANAIQFKANVIFDYQEVFKNIPLNTTFIYLNFNFLNKEFIHKIATFLNTKNLFFQLDIIGNLAESGNWFVNLKEDFLQLKEIQQKIKNSISISADLYQESGATITQQLAYTLAHANDYIDKLGEKCISNMHFTFSVSGNYFFEIAKLRAFRLLWSTLLDAYDIKDTKAHIFVKPSLRNKTIYNAHINMVRTTSECMSAVLGGANTIANISFDGIYNKSNKFSERISRNQLLILKEESFFKDAQKFADGAYYLDSITEQLAENALALFKQIEKSGGFLKQLKNGTIQKKIKENANKEEERITKHKDLLLGTNYQQETNDTMQQHLKLYPFIKQRNTKTLIPPIIRKRLSESIEKQRLDNEINNF